VSEYERLTHGLFPYMMSITNDTDPVVFSHLVQERIASVIEMERCTSRFTCNHAKALAARIGDSPTLRRATVAARRFGGLLAEWLEGAHGVLIRRAVECVRSYGVAPLLPSLGTAGNLGPSICGQYEPALHSVVIQLDVVAAANDPPLQLLDVLLHEQVHALIYQNLGHDPDRRELEWLHELAAITTSHQAIVDAGRSLDCDAEVQTKCRMLRERQQYGDLAQSVIDHMPDPLLAWKTWQDIISLPDDAKRQYARREIIEPILWERGWNGSFPFHYANKRISLRYCLRLVDEPGCATIL